MKFAKGLENIQALPMLTENYLVVTSPYNEMVKNLKLKTWVIINEPSYPKNLREFKKKIWLTIEHCTRNRHHYHSRDNQKKSLTYRWKDQFSKRKLMFSSLKMSMKQSLLCPKITSVKKSLPTWMITIEGITI